MDQKQLKIFVDAHCFDKPTEGMHTFIHGIYSVLVKDYPDLDIYFGVYNIENFKTAFPSVATDHILQYSRRAKGFTRFFSAIPHYIKKYKFDFCHFQYVSPSPIKECKYIVTLHDIAFNRFSSGLPFLYRISRNYFFRTSFRKAKIKTTVSSYSKQNISSDYNIREEEINVIPSGVSNVVNSIRDKPGSRQRIKEKYGMGDFILYVSRIEPRKNHLLLLEVYLELELYKKDIHLVFIGTESIPVPALNNKIGSLSGFEKKYFHWLQHMDTNSLADFYKATSLFVYPSLAEGFGVPPLEAALMGTPVLCSSATAMKDYYFFEPNTFNPDNKQELKEKLQAILNNPPLDKKLDSIANEIKTRYNWEGNAKDFYTLLKNNY
jgi:glycosyltransferase involved in cell wall biosynthesis